MPSTLEIEAKNVDQAVQKACEQLKLSPKELKYDVLSHGSTGIFGLGRTRKARIRVKNVVQGAATEGADDKTARDHQPAQKSHIDDRQSDSNQESITDSSAFGDTNHSLGMGKDVLQRIIDSITDDALIRVDEQSERVVYRIEGGNAAILIGRHGQTLEAIQCIVEKVVNKHNNDRIRVQVDVGGYLKNRRNRLIRNAERLAVKCRRTRKPVSAGLLNAYDRRIVHLALKDNQNVRTRSTGDGLLRNLMILPRKATTEGMKKR